MIEGLVIKRINYEETSFILTILSIDGFKSVMVKGAKKKNSLKLGVSEPLTLISFVPSKSVKMPTLIEGSVINNFDNIKKDLSKLSIATVVIEYAYQLRESDVEVKKIYNITLSTLIRIDESDNPELYLFRFETVLLGYLGVALEENYLVSNLYGNQELIDSLFALMNDEEVVNHEILREFYIKYYERELGITLRSKKLYLDLFRGKL